MVKIAKREVHKDIVLLIVAIAQFMVVLDVSIVNVALPSIYKSLHFSSQSNLQWIVTAYTLAFGGFLLLGGRAADLYGRRKLFITAVSLFAVASLFTGLSQNSTMIIVARAIQGLMAAFMSPAALSIVLTTFNEGKERAKALSVWGGVAAGGAAAGLLLGGILTEFLGWRWNFFVNVPVGIAVAIAAWLYVPESKAGLDHKKLDVPGAVTVTAGLMLLVYTFTKGPIDGWTNHVTLEFLAGSLVLLAAFIVNENRSKHPLMPLNIFRVGNIAAANVMQLPVTAAVFSMFFFITLYVQTVLNYSPLVAGFSFLPVSLVIGGVAVTMQHIVGKVGFKKPISIAPFSLALGLFLLSRIPVHGHYLTNVLPGLVIIAASMGVLFIGITIAATNGVPPKQSGLASGLLNTSQQIGGSLGLAILSGISASGAVSYVKTHFSSAHSKLFPKYAEVNGFHHALIATIFFALGAGVVALFFVKEKAGETVAIDPTAMAG